MKKIICIAAALTIAATTFSQEKRKDADPKGQPSAATKGVAKSKINGSDTIRERKPFKAKQPQ